MKLRLFLCLISASLSLAGSHSLQYFTALTARVNFTFGLVDGEQFLYYSPSNNRTIIAEWINNFTLPHYWNSETHRFSGEQNDLHYHFSQLVKNFNHTARDHTMQWMYGCQLHDNGTTRGNNLYSYDGTDFLYLDISTSSWHAANEKAELFKNKWDTTGEEATHMRKYLDEKCIDSLKEYVSPLSRLQSSQRKVPPEVSVFQKHSSSPEVVCHATGFFSKPLNMTWQKDGEEVYENVELRETLPNQDGSFQKRSILKVPAEELQKHNYTCVVQHSSLEKELVKLVPPVSRTPRGGRSDVVMLTVWITVSVLAFALISLLPVLMECLFIRLFGPVINN